jgi:NADH:ubiquinone oxidoreductase subunit C
MTQEELLSKLAAKLPQLEKAAQPVKDYVTMRLKSPDQILQTARILKDELGFDYLEIVSATDWLGPVEPKGYIRNPNPIVFLPEGATPYDQPTATPGFNYRPVFDMLWVFGNIPEKQKVFIRCELARDKAKVPSLTGLFKAADWQERETWDLMGVEFTGHPNLKKILTPDFTVGHPLRKDYVHVKDRFDD